MMTGNVSLNSGMQNINTSGMVAPDSANNEYQQQIAEKKQSIKSLSSDSEMSPAEKEKERRKLQQQIAELNRELRRQQEAEKEKAAEAVKQQEKKATLREDLIKETQKTEKADKVTKEEEQEKLEIVKEDTENEAVEPEDTTLPPETIQELMATDFKRQQEMTQNKMTKQREAQKDIIEAEMTQDAIHGSENQAKEEVLSKMMKKEEVIHQVQDYINDPFAASNDSGFEVKVVIREK